MKPPVRCQVVAQLQAQLRRWEEAKRPAVTIRTSTGCVQIDRLLPAGGVTRGTLIEWLADGEGSGAMWLALVAAIKACQGHGPLLVIDGRQTFHPPAAMAAGMDLQRLIVVRPATARDETWALDQSLRSTGVGAVLCLTDRLRQRAARRLQLAAEASGGVGFLVRPASVRCEPCWAAVRLLVEPRPSAAGRRLTGGRRLDVELLKTRGTVASELTGKRRLELEVDDETGVVRAVARLASPATQRRSSGA
jgi:protein ImuA